MRYAFADCLMDIENFRFFRNGEPQAIEPQVFDLLRLLAEHAGQLVTRDQLIETVWGGRIVSEATISARINAARAAVGDSGKAQAVIRTVPRRGIELVVPVQIAETAPTAAPEPAAQSMGKPSQQTIRYTTSADGTQIAFAISGSGPPLLRAAHQVTHVELDWTSPLWRPGFDAVGAHHTLIRYDVRGTGFSDPQSEGDGAKQHLEDLIAVADAAGLDRFPIWATLNSARIAIQFAAENPDRVSRMVIQEGYARGRAIRAPGQAPSGEDPFITLLRSGGWGDPANGFMRAWISIAAPELRHDDTSALIELFGNACAPESALALRRVIDQFDARPYLKDVQAPTLVIHARNDILHPVTEGRTLAAGIPGAEFMVVESANTLCLAPDPTCPAQVEAILAFLAKDADIGGDLVGT